MKPPNSYFGRMTVCTVLSVLTIANVGCCGLGLHTHDDENCFTQCHGASAKVAVVNVGGQVHEPRTIELGADGLTLHRALMSAGGAREVSVAEADTTSAPQSNAELQRLTEVARDVGKYKFFREVLDLAQEPHEIEARELAKAVLSQLEEVETTPEEEEDAQEFSETARSKYEEVKKELANQEETLDRIIAKLSKSLKGEQLRTLRRQGEFIGEYQEKLNLYDQQPEYFLDSREQYEKVLSEHTEVEKKLLPHLIKPDGRASVRSVRPEFLVALERPSAEPPVTYYFPYNLATAGMASDIELQDGDSVSVVDIRETVLHTPDAGLQSVGNNVAIQGYVQVPGITDGLSTISSVHSLSKRTINDPRSVWTLVRPAANGERQFVFVLPDRLVTSNGAVADAPTQGGDVYTYTILPQVPIVFETLLAGTLKTEKRRCLETLRSLKQEHKRKTHRLFNRVRNRLSAACNRLPNH